MQGHDTHTQRARNFALQLPLPRQIICLRQLRRDFHHRVTPGHSSLPVAVTSISLTEQPRNCCFLDKRGHWAEYSPLADDDGARGAAELSNSKPPPRGDRSGVSALDTRRSSLPSFPPSEPRRSAEYVVNRDYDSNDPYGQDRKQQNIAQERRHIAPPLYLPCACPSCHSKVLVWSDTRHTNRHKLFHASRTI